MDFSRDALATALPEGPSRALRVLDDSEANGWSESHPQVIVGPVLKGDFVASVQAQPERPPKPFNADTGIDGCGRIRSLCR